MTEPAYVVQAAAWALVWAGAGLTARDLLARRRERERAAAAAAVARRRPLTTQGRQ